MQDKHTIENEALATYERFVAQRDRVDSGEISWAGLADFFTEDAVYIDPAWGRQEGRETIRKFFVDSMAGLTGYGWSTPERWTMVDGHRLVSHWDQILGQKPDGGEWMVPAMAWKPPPEFNMPPRKPDWSTDLPAAWSHLAHAFDTA